MRVHVHDIEAGANPGLVYGWRMWMTVTVYDAMERPVRGATVHAMFTGAQEQTCVTDVSGVCTIMPNTKYEAGTLYGWVRNITREAATYYNPANHDADGDTNGRSVAVTVTGTLTPTATPTRTATPSPTPTQVSGGAPVHVHDIDAHIEEALGWWRMTMTLRVSDWLERPVAGATIHAAFSGGQLVMCVTNSTGTCTVHSRARVGSGTVTGWVRNITRAGIRYFNSMNHDEDGGTNGVWTSVTHP
jgi:hypothetical protein